jgi:hypothetical protein
MVLAGAHITVARHLEPRTDSPLLDVAGENHSFRRSLGVQGGNCVKNQTSFVFADLVLLAILMPHEIYPFWLLHCTGHSPGIVDIMSIDCIETCTQSHNILHAFPCHCLVGQFNSTKWGKSGEKQRQISSRDNKTSKFCIRSDGPPHTVENCPMHTTRGTTSQGWFLQAGSGVAPARYGEEIPGDLLL